MSKKIAVINDLSGFGRCSLTAAISVIAAMGVQRERAARLVHAYGRHIGGGGDGRPALPAAHGGPERTDRVSQLFL